MCWAIIACRTALTSLRQPSFLPLSASLLWLQFPASSLPSPSPTTSSFIPPLSLLDRSSTAPTHPSPSPPAPTSRFDRFRCFLRRSSALQPLQDLVPRHHRIRGIAFRRSSGFRCRFPGCHRSAFGSNRVRTRVTFDRHHFGLLRTLQVGSFTAPPALPEQLRDLGGSVPVRRLRVSIFPLGSLLRTR